MTNGGISADLMVEVEQEFVEGSVLSLNNGKRERKITINQEFIQELKADVTDRLSFILALFMQLRLKRLPCEEVSNATNDEFNYKFRSIFFDTIDLSKIGEKYSDAVRYFCDEIWTPDLTCKINRPCTVKNGTYILDKHIMPSALLDVVAWDGAPLKNLKTFLEMIGKIENALLMPVFSPEEEVFEPYFALLEMAHEVAVPQEHLQPLVRKSIDNFFEDNFTDSVSALGLAAEDVLTQIYETLYREQLTKGFTLGQLSDEIHAKAGIRFSKKEDAAPNLSTLFPEMKQAIDDPGLSAASAVALLRKTVVLTIELQKHAHSRIDKFGKPERKFTIYPEPVAHAVNELIRYRNAASHKSRVPIGPVECRRTAHSFVVLFSWWAREKQNIDWFMTPEDILLACIERNSK